MSNFGNQNFRKYVMNGRKSVSRTGGLSNKYEKALVAASTGKKKAPKIE